MIGTIIGVIAFIALIAGATYAWVTNGITPTNGNYNLGTMKFNVTYNKGTDITAATGGVPIVSTPTTENTASLSVTANKVNGSAPGTLTISLNTNETGTDAALLNANVLHYAICVGTCTNTSNLTQVANTNTITSTGKLDILSTPLTASPTTYNIYFWLDSSAMNETLVGKSYSGFISADAIQIDTE